MGCRGPVTYNACAVTKWNNGVSFPIQSGHGCIGCSEENFWDNGPFYNRLTNLPGFGIESTADQVGAILGAATAAGLAGHAALTFVRKRDVVAAHEVPETPVKE
jgi:hydrogenase small subunit